MKLLFGSRGTGQNPADELTVQSERAVDMGICVLIGPDPCIFVRFFEAGILGHTQAATCMLEWIGKLLQVLLKSGDDSSELSRSGFGLGDHERSILPPEGQKMQPKRHPPRRYLRKWPAGA